MLNIKKVVASLCVTAMALTAAAFPALADLNASYTFSLVTSENNEYDDGYMYLTLTSDGFDGSDAYTSAGQVTFNVTKGAFNSASAIMLGKRNNTGGLYSPKSVNGSSDTAASFDISLNSTVSDSYDVLTIQWYGAVETFMTSTGDFIDIELEYNDPEIDAVFTPDTSSADRFFAKAVDSEKNVLSNSVTVNENSYVNYKLDVATHTLSVVNEAPTPTATWVAATQVGDVQVGDERFQQDGKAVAYKATLNAANRQDKLTWAAKVNGVGKGVSVDTPGTVGGSGDVLFGLIISGLNDEVVSDVYAGWGELSGSENSPWKE